jgi:putative hydrolase of the HAD superfamily
MARDASEIDVWVFDLDNTLYPAACDLFPQVRLRIREYVERFLGLGPEAAHRVQKDYYFRFGTTMNGLMELHGLDPQDYLGYVHDVDLSALSPDPGLNAALRALPGRRLVYTNGSRAHAERVLERLQLADAFEEIFDIEAAAFRPKPQPEPYGELLRRHAIRAERSAFIEDTARNLVPAHALGMTTVWLDHGHPDMVVGLEPEAIHHRIEDLKAWLDEAAGSTAAAGPA